MEKPIAFEQFVANYFQKKGYKINLTASSGDYGVDIFAQNSFHKIAIQVKMYGNSTRKINRKCVMELHGAKDYFDCDKAIIATNGGILNDALEVAKKLNIEILNLEFNLELKKSETDYISFDSIWLNYIIPLKGKELIREDGSKNTILDVDWSRVRRLTSNGKENKINIEIFREAYNILLKQGYVSRDYINQNYLGRASSGVILILSQLPFIELRKNPLGLVFKDDETTYLLKSPANATRLLKSIEDYKKGLGQERDLIEV